MTDSHKVCPICEARNHRNAALCAVCGTTIAEIAPKEGYGEDETPVAFYDYRLGETDLAEDSLSVKGRIMSLILVAAVLTVVGGLAAVALTERRLDDEATSIQVDSTASPTRVSGPSITPGTPTATFTASPIPSATFTPTPTPAPCIRRVADGDSLIAIVSRCGHSSLDILPTVMALNRITDETRLQIGQEIIVPHPSPTSDPAATAAPGASAAADSGKEQLTRLAFEPFAPTLTPTLLPGLMWHFVQPDEDMIFIAAEYETNVKALSDLNPVIDFLLCDFGLVYGGPECTVQLRISQQIRVPAPAPTMTQISANSGSETPSPPPTATFNAPIAQSPADEAFFSPRERVTLRWVGTGRLDTDEVYRISLTNTEGGVHFEADTRELFFIVPSEWQSQDASSHRYSWLISVADINSNTTTFETAARTFIWQGAGQAEA